MSITIVTGADIGETLPAVSVILAATAHGPSPRAGRVHDFTVAEATNEHSADAAAAETPRTFAPAVCTEPDDVATTSTRSPDDASGMTMVGVFVLVTLPVLPLPIESGFVNVGAEVSMVKVRQSDAATINPLISCDER